MGQKKNTFPHIFGLCNFKTRFNTYVSELMKITGEKGKHVVYTLSITRDFKFKKKRELLRKKIEKKN